MSHTQSSDVVEHVSTVPFAPTLDRLTKAIEAAGMTIFARIDHAASALEIGMTMPPTMVLFYGNPRGGTPIMQATPQAALDLPLRVLVRESDDKEVLISFHPIALTLQRAGVPEALLSKLEPAQQVLIKAVTS